MPSFSPRALLFGGLPTASLWLLGAHAAVEQIPFSPCALLRAYYPPLSISPASDAIGSFASNFATQWDDLIQAGGSEDYGPITPNTTSFSVVLFSGSADSDDAIFFEYHHTASMAQSDGSTNVTSDTLFPLGDLTQLFTVYTWLLRMGETWETPITNFLPELSGLEALSGEVSIPWEDVTIGTLAGQMSGLPRDCKSNYLAMTAGVHILTLKFAAYACTIDKPCDWEGSFNHITFYSCPFKCTD